MNPIDISKEFGELKKFNEELAKTAELTGQLLTNSKNLTKELGKTKGLSDQNKKRAEVQKQQNEVERVGNNLTKQKNTLIAKQDKSLRQLTRETIKEREAVQQLNKEIKAEGDAYKKLNLQYQKAATNAKKLAAQYGVNSKQAKKAALAATKYGNELKKIDASVGQQQRKVGGYFSAIVKGTAAFAATTLTARAAFTVLKNSIRTIANFEQAMSKVRAVTGALPKDFKALSSDAKRLGSETSKSATEVAGLQLEFAKLGFSTAEILNATEATISLSIAAGSDLAESAVVAASTIKAFGLDASETQRVVDVMAKAFSSSALDLEKFKTAMGAVAPVAKAGGKDIEFAAAQLSILADNGLDASTSGTSLRNMFLELNKQGLTWEEGLEKINTSTNKNVTALDLFGKRGATAALILADNVDKAAALEIAYDGAAGSAAEMARIMEDNLIGDTNKLSSAWEGFILGLNKGDGTISRVLRNATQNVTALINKLKVLNLTQEETQELLNNRLATETFESYIRGIDQATKKLKTVEDVEAERAKLLADYIADTERAVKENEDLAKSFEGSDIAASNFYENSAVQNRILLNLLIDSNSTISEANELDKDGNVITETKIKALKELARIRADLTGEEINYLTFLDMEADLQDENHNELMKQINREDAEKKALHDLDRENHEDVLRWIDEEDQRRLLRLDLIKSIKQQEWDIVNQTGNTIFNLEQAQRDRELSSIQADYEAKIESAEGNNALQERLTEELAAEQLRIKQEQAKSERNQALFNLAITTAQKGFEIKAQAAVLASNPVTAALAPLALAQLGLLLSSSLISGALIASTEIPGFFKGTENAPAGLAHIAEKGAELLTMPSGESLLVNEPSLMNLEAGTKVKTAEQTTDILNKAIYNDIAVNGNEGIENRLDKLNRSINNQAKEVTIFDDDGIKRHLAKGNSITNYQNRRGRK